jgi:hypothetical protein
MAASLTYNDEVLDPGDGLAIRLQFDREQSDLFERQAPSVSLGFLSGVAWTPDWIKLFRNCQIVIAGFENTSPDDYGKRCYNTDSLGYFGTYSLLHSVRPRLLIISEFNRREGDIRLEIIRQMRDEANHLAIPTTILPADNGLCLNLNSQSVYCTMTRTLVDPTALRMIKPEDPFGQLHYLAPQCVL